jgi:putative intracellular protease/amidase
MRIDLLLWGIAGAAALALLGLAVRIATLPAAPGPMVASPVPAAEAQAMLRALKPPKRARPLIAIAGLNQATETTDYIMPAGILRRANVADVMMLAPATGPVTLYPALRVLPDASFAQFDSAHPDGADYVIVPAMEPGDDPVALGWIKAQAAKGATIIGVCVGARVLSETGLLDGRRATTHWYYLDGMLKRHPSIRYVPDRRFVADGNRITTTGITASMPMMLTLVEAIAGRNKAEAVARDLGVAEWNARHASAAFRFNRPFALTIMGNALAFWRHQEREIALKPGLDEVSLALTADAWSRTYRSRAVTLGTAPVTSRNGIRILPDRQAPRGRAMPDHGDLAPKPALDATLDDIGAILGAPTRRVVAMQLEYPENAR